VAGAGKNLNARDFVKKVGKKSYCRKRSAIGSAKAGILP
jgi:hypothetical protein